MKKKHDEKKSICYSLFSFRNYAIVFFAMCFVVSCAILVLLKGLKLERDSLLYHAPASFVTILLLSVLFTLMLGINRKIRFEKPVKEILSATAKIKDGNLSVQIPPLRHLFHTENEFDLIIENFNTMAKELSGVETLRSDFIANVSHELKTPLSVIQNYATMLQAPLISDSERIEYARNCAAASRRLTALITNILKLNKLENQQIFPLKTRFNLSEQLTESLLDFEQVWEDKQIEIETDLEDEVMIEGDEELLSLVWHNLFSNAFKFTSKGGFVAVSLHEENGQAKISVKDTGRGISEEAQNHIFEKFYQADTSRATQGNGLGLALVKRVLDIFGGTITVKSKLGEGSQFDVYLNTKYEV